MLGFCSTLGFGLNYGNDQRWMWIDGWCYLEISCKLIVYCSAQVTLRLTLARAGEQVFRRITCLVCYTISLQLIFRYKQHQSFTLHTSEPSTFHKLTALFVFQVLALRSCGRTQTQNCFCHFGAKQLSLVQINDYALKNICNWFCKKSSR